jgi:hypothetical protein
MDVRAAVARRHRRVGSGPLWLARFTLAYAFVAVAGSWIALASTGSFDPGRVLMASLSAALATLPLLVLVARYKYEGTL